MSVANRPVHRPLSPHLPGLSSAAHLRPFDSSHRATGIALSVGALYLAIWVMYAAAAAVPTPVPELQWLDHRPLLLGGWLFCTFYHLCNGIRHLFWDAGYGFELKDAYRSGWLVVACLAGRHAVSWIVGLRLV